MPRRQETTKTKIIRLVFGTVNGLILCIGVGIGFAGFYGRGLSSSLLRQQLLNETGANSTGSSTGNVTAAWSSAMVGMTAYDWLVICGALTTGTSVLGFWGACWTDKRKRRRLDILMCYNWVLVLAGAFTLWLGITCFVFASRAEYYMDQYWTSISSAFPPGVDQAEAYQRIADQMSVAGALGVVASALLVVGLYCSAHLVGHRYLTRFYLMWVNGISMMCGAILGTSGLVVANENIGGEWLATLVSSLGGSTFCLAFIGLHGARSESTICLCVFLMLMMAIIVGIAVCVVFSFMYADPEWVRARWDEVGPQVYPISSDHAIAVLNANFASLGIASSIAGVLMLLNTWAAYHLRRRIRRDGRFYQPLDENYELPERTKQP